jgi:probable rRNA maturation factor
MSTANFTPAPMVEVLVQSPLWQGGDDVEGVLRKAIAKAALSVAGRADAAVPPASMAGELAVVLTDDDSIRKLNYRWRNLDRPTNVLSFRSTDLPGGIPAVLGDIVIAFETTAREAAAEGKPFIHHVAHLGVHGFLHLMGYDHQSDAEADAMESLERRILASLDVPDPYAAEPGTHG